MSITNETIMVHVSDGVVDLTPRRLPSRGWDDISAPLHVLGADYLKTRGWLPYTYSPPVFDDATQELGPLEFLVGANSVTGSNQVINLTEYEIYLKDMAEWKRQIALTDSKLSMSEYYHIRYDHDGHSADAYKQEGYTEKEALRVARPAVVEAP